MSAQLRDVFICHAGEDKEDVVRPMVEAFSEAGVTCWFDEAEVRWGDSITQRVDEGLATSRYVIVVLSPAFMDKNWPQRELNSALNTEASSGQVRVLPLLVGTEREKTTILESFPLLNDKRYLPWEGELRKIVEAMLARLGSDSDAAGQTASRSLGLRIPLPKIKKQFSQRDRDLFLRNAFAIIRQYFKDALEQLGRQDQQVETDFVEVHSFKFLCTIYVRGDAASRCKIWIGGGRGLSHAIAYSSGQSGIDSDDSYNDLVSLADDEQRLGFQLPNMWHGRQEYPDDGVLTSEQAAEYLWLRFTESLR